jgi:hypothetical protein
VSRFPIAILALVLVSSLPAQAAPETGLRFAITAPGPATPVTGRMLLLISTDDTAEPRLQITDGPKTQQVFGIDVANLGAGKPAVIDGSALGYPLEGLRDLRAGTYTVQALLHRYETFRRADGHVVQLPMDRGEGQQWNRAPGNLYSVPRKVALDPSRAQTIALVLDQTIPPIADPPETKYIKHERIQSERLTKFWGRPMFLGAHVLLPEGFDAHPQARYPLVINHGHFPRTFGGFREEPPDPDLKPEHSERFNWPAYNRTEQEYEYQLF